MEKLNVYVASSWRNEQQPELVIILEELGFEVYNFRNEATSFRWADVDKDYLNWNTEQFRNALQHPLARRAYESDFNAMQWADVCVLLLPCGKSAHLEAGYMAGMGKPVVAFVTNADDVELSYSMMALVTNNGKELYEFLKGIQAKGIKDETDLRIEQLKAQGYDGLVVKDLPDDCGCHFDENFPCGYNCLLSGDCVPAYQHKDEKFYLEPEEPSPCPLP